MNTVVTLSDDHHRLIAHQPFVILVFFLLLTCREILNTRMWVGKWSINFTHHHRAGTALFSKHTQVLWPNYWKICLTNKCGTQIKY